MFSVEDRDAVSAQVIETGESDPRIVAGAVIGSLALGSGDRYSDIDLTFAVADGVPIEAVLAEWTARMSAEFGAVQLFDLGSGPSIYRVFLLPGCLQVDLSFTPAAAFAPRGPRFRLLFGTAGELQAAPGRSAEDMVGYAVHHALRARFCIERQRLWQAGYWIGSLREEVMGLACQRRGLDPSHGRGFDELPPAVLEGCSAALVHAVDPAELLRALRAAIAVLRAEAPDLTSAVASQLAELTAEQ